MHETCPPLLSEFPVTIKRIWRSIKVIEAEKVERKLLKAKIMIVVEMLVVVVMLMIV